MTTKPTPPMDHLGPQLQTRRHELGLTLRRLAEHLDSHASMLSSYETGRNTPTFTALCRLLTQLDASITVTAEHVNGPQTFMLDAEYPASTFLRQARTHLGLSQERAARLAGLGIGAVVVPEKPGSNPRVSTLHQRLVDYNYTQITWTLTPVEGEPK